VIGKASPTPADGVYGVAVFRQPYGACPGEDITEVFVMDRVLASISLITQITHLINIVYSLIGITYHPSSHLKYEAMIRTYFGYGTRLTSVWYCDRWCRYSIVGWCL
jgi:hypothetical protein